MTHFAPSVEHNHIMHLILISNETPFSGIFPCGFLRICPTYNNASYADPGLRCCWIFAPSFLNSRITSCTTLISNRYLNPQMPTPHRQCFRVDTILYQGYTKRQCAAVQMRVLVNTVLAHTAGAQDTEAYEQ